MRNRRIISFFLIAVLLLWTAVFAEDTAIYPSDSITMTNIRIENEGYVGTVRTLKEWNGFLFAAVTYENDTTANGNQVIVYDLKSSEVDYTAMKTALIDGTSARKYPDAALNVFAGWNMNDLGIPVTGDSTQEQIIGIDVTDDRICVLTRSLNSSSFKVAGLRVYQNSIERGVNPGVPVQLYGETGTTLYNNGHASLLDIMSNNMMEGPVTKNIGDNLVVIYPHTAIHNARGAQISIITFTDNEVSAINKRPYTILKKPDGSNLTSNGATLSDVAFAGNKAYIVVVDTSDSKKKYLEVVDFSTPTNPILISSTLISDDGDINTATANISLCGKYAYITTSGDKCASSSYLYIVDTETMQVVKSITATEVGFTFTNSAGFGKSYVNDNVFIAFEGYTRAKAYCIIEFDERFNIKTNRSVVNNIHTEMVAQANGVIAYNGDLYVSCDKPATQTREGLKDIYNSGMIAAFNISDCAIWDEITENYDAKNLKRTLMADETVNIAANAVVSNALIDATFGSVNIGDTTVKGYMSFDAEGKIDTAQLGTIISFETSGDKENTNHWGFVKTVEFSEISSSYTVLLSASNGDTYNVPFYFGEEGIFEGTARLLIGVQNVPAEIDILCQ